MKAGVGAPGRAQIPERTLRTDRWRIYPLTTGAILLFFIAYATVRIFMNKWYWAPEEHYLTPIYSPCLSESCVPGSSHFGTPLPEIPWFLPMAIITFVVLAGFRGTCYYYRKAGYRSLFMAPAACAVPEPHKKYTGESKFPLVLLNAHRYFFYGALVFAAINVYDAVLAFQGKDGGFGMGLGTVIILINLVMLTAYTLSCHACRHIVGGRLKNFSKHPLRYRYWTFVSKLNARHGQYAMISLFTVILTDAYIMAVSAGWITDLRIFN
ncbi:hypothetical protein [Actinophytocola xanthii]|uniref:Succinate dehydrogenase n=1 Tax=Actinophytocola xanthii TaxID=1912961 RepID=A0A1Q8CRA1_9PSEU|nr:hypothetical protein [Actinophytocola xanthii]OLF16867.1 hypothetical protein BU204_14255 [Actinophytocola xanthii]